MPDVIKQMKDAKRRLFSVLIAEADKLDVPFSNAPDQSPWSRSVKPTMKALDDAHAAVAELVAALQRELAEAKAERDTNFSVLQRVSKGGWESATELVNERIARKQAERELAEAKQAVYTAQITHARATHFDRMHAPDCPVCDVLVPLSLDLPARSDDITEIRRLAQATTEETNDEARRRGQRADERRPERDDQASADIGPWDPHVRREGQGRPRRRPA